jgi:N-acetylglucosamine kinase-like BadF-type ATPase
VRAVGAAHALINLDVAVDAAHQAAGTRGATVDVAVLALAGSSLPDVQAVVMDWAKRRDLAVRIDVVHDADPVLAVGAPNNSGVALIVGTGSVAIGIDSSGRKSIAGGWGHWFGDTGSGYDLGRRALAAVADAVDGIGPETSLVQQILERLRTDDPREILRQLGLAVDIRQEIATLAPILLGAAEGGDKVAADIVMDAATATARLVRATTEKLGLGADAPLALAGGIVCSNDYYRDILIRQLAENGLHPEPLTVVAEPVEGSLIMARDRLLAGTNG